MAADQSRDPVPTHPTDNSFDIIKLDMDRQGWTGRASTIPLPGGGNTPSGSGEKDK